MNNIIKIRASVFIPTAWTEPKQKENTEEIIQFEGDFREFTPFAVNAMRSRIEQEVVVDFYKKEVFNYANTGITTEKISFPDGTNKKRQGKADTKDIVCTDISWTDKTVSLTMHGSASNPLNDKAPSSDYLLKVKISIYGEINIFGMHDGFPCYEFYSQHNFDDITTIHLHDFRNSGEGPEALGGEMDCSFKY